MANFETFHRNISSSTNLLFLKNQKYVLNFLFICELNYRGFPSIYSNILLNLKSNKWYIVHTISIFVIDIQEEICKKMRKKLATFLSVYEFVCCCCVVRFYVSTTLLTRVVLFWHFNTQNLQDKQNFSHALRESLVVLAKALKPKTLMMMFEST